MYYEYKEELYYICIYIIKTLYEQDKKICNKLFHILLLYILNIH